MSLDQLLESIIESHEVMEDNLQTVIEQKMDDLRKNMDLKLNEVKLQFEDLESTRRIKIKKQNDHNINISQNPSQDIHVKSDDFKSFKSDIVLMKLELTQILLEKENDIKYIQENANTVINNLKDKIKKLEETLEKKNNAANVDESCIKDFASDTTVEETLRSEVKILNSRIFLMQENAKSNILQNCQDIEAKNKRLSKQDAKIKELQGCIAELQTRSLEQDDDCSDLIQFEEEIDDLKKVYKKNIETLETEYEEKISVLRKDNEDITDSLNSYNDRLETKDKEIKAIAKVLDDQKNKNTELEDKVKRREMYMKQLEKEVRFWKNYEKYLRNSLKARDASLERARKPVSTEEKGVEVESRGIEGRKQRSRTRGRCGRSVTTKNKDSNPDVFGERNDTARREKFDRSCRNDDTNCSNGKNNGSNNEKNNGKNNDKKNDIKNDKNNGRNQSNNRKSNQIKDNNNNDVNDFTKTNASFKTMNSSQVNKSSYTYSRGLKNLHVISNKQDNKSSRSNSDASNSISSGSDHDTVASAVSHVRIKFQGPGPQEVHFRVKHMDEIFWTLVSYSSKVGLPASALIYKYKSITLKGIETPDSLGMFSGDAMHTVQVYRDYN